jgi:GNAT superfamily N-acetyltransferase
MKVIIRRARYSDLSRLQELGTELMLSDKVFDPLLNEQWYFEDEGKQYLLKNIRGRNRVCFLAVVQNEIIGYATGSILKEDAWRRIKRAELVNLIVTRKYRNHGAGHLLMAAFKGWGTSKGAKRFKVIASAPNKDAIRFYKDNGFTAQLLTLEAK